MKNDIITEFDKGIIFILFTPCGLIFPSIYNLFYNLTPSIYFLSIGLIIEYVLLQRISICIFKEKEFSIKWLFRFSINSNILYSQIDKACYCWSGRGGKYIRIYFSTKGKDGKYIYCFYKQKTKYFYLLKFLQSKGILIEFRGFDKNEQKIIWQEINRIQLE